MIKKFLNIFRQKNLSKSPFFFRLFPHNSSPLLSLISGSGAVALWIQQRFGITMRGCGGASTARPSRAICPNHQRSALRVAVWDRGERGAERRIYDVTPGSTPPKGTDNSASAGEGASGAVARGDAENHRGLSTMWPHLHLQAASE